MRQSVVAINYSPKKFQLIAKPFISHRLGWGRGERYIVSESLVKEKDDNLRAFDLRAVAGLRIPVHWVEICEFIYQKGNKK